MLTRREGESIIIYKDDIEITIKPSEITGKQANISVDAPEEYYCSNSS